jgi:protein-S-isoprenylcysteine O-methyltransferase Ste14
LLVIGVLLAAAGPAAELLGILEPVGAPFASLANLAGLLLALAGCGLTLVAQLQMGSSWRIGVDARETTPLITDGLFRFVRNPIFSGMMLTCAGGLLLAPNALSLLALASVVAGLEIHVRRVEEPYLARIHGARYRAYAGRVGRFVPRCGRLS